MAVKLPYEDMCFELDVMLEYMKRWTNVDGRLIGHDAVANSMFDGIHEFLLTKRRERVAAMKAKEGLTAKSPRARMGHGHDRRTTWPRE